MSESKKAHAPYNFIPLEQNPLARYKDLSDIPTQDHWDDKLFTGKITLTLTAATPVFISNGKKGDKADFFRDAAGQYAIPGSSFRGLLRQNMQILGFGALREKEDYNDYRLYYRKIASARPSLDGGLKETYRKNLGVDRNGIPQKVYTGFLYREAENYFIQKTDQEIIKIKRASPSAAPWKDRWAFSERAWCKEDGTLLQSEEEGAISGYLLGVGQMKGQKTLYFFPESSSEDVISLTEKEVIAYIEDYEARKGVLGGTSENKADPSFWALPKSGERKPVFYTQDGEIRSFGMSQYLRIQYENTIGEGIPKVDTTPFLDYAYAIFGFAGEEKAIASRVTVENLVANKGAKTCTPFCTILGEPKLSFYPGYVCNGENYNVQGFQMRGIKQYWLKEACWTESKSAKISTTICPLPEGTSFTGTISYRNLREDELGLLLWCICLGENCYQTIGMGKPLGMGRIAVTIDNLWESQPEALYGSGKLCVDRAEKNEATASRVQALIGAYQRFVEEKKIYGEDLLQHPSIRNFLLMKRTIIKDPQMVSYMSLKKFQNLSDPLPTADEVVPTAVEVTCFEQIRPDMYLKGTVERLLPKGFLVTLCPGVTGKVAESESVQVGDVVSVKVKKSENPRSIALMLIP